MAKPSSQQLQDAIDDVTLGRLAPDQIADAALALLEAGHDSPTLRVLAVSHGDRWDVIGQRFWQSVRELGGVEPPPEEAGLRVAKRIAAAVLRGEVSPYVGATRIWWEVSKDYPGLEQLSIFSRIADAYEDDLHDHPADEEAIRRQCAALLAEP